MTTYGQGCRLNHPSFLHPHHHMIQTTHTQTTAEISSSNKMPSETRSDGIFAQLRQGLKP
ncbi:TPA: hypothetical protein ACQUJI_000266 [Neisseria cinerea]